MAPGKSNLMTPEISSDIEKIHQAVTRIAAEKSTAQSQIIAIDMYSGFSDDLLADNVHYNKKGAEFIAERYFKVLKDVLKK